MNYFHFENNMSQIKSVKVTHKFNVKYLIPQNIVYASQFYTDKKEVFQIFLRKYLGFQ